MVVVANRLPFDMEKLPDGSTKARQAPGGLVTALAPILSRRQGAWIGWPGSPDVTVEPTSTDGLSLHPGHADRRRGRRLLRGLLQRDPVAALSRCCRRIAVPPRVVGGLPAGQREVRRVGGRPRGARRDRLGARLPTAARPAIAPPAASRRADRVLPAHPVPAGRAVHAAALADPDHPGTARRGPDRFPAARWRPEFQPAGQVAGRRRDHRRYRSSTTAARFGRPRTRSPSTRPNSPRWPPPRGSTTPPSSSGTTSAVRARSSWGSTGWITPRASTSGCGRSGNCWPRATRRSRTR